MKKSIFIGIFLLSMGITYAQKNVVKFNPLSLLFVWSDLVTYERGIGNHSSLQLGAGIKNSNNLNGELKYRGGSLMYRYYIKESLSKFYGGIEMSYARVNEEYDEFSFLPTEYPDSSKFDFNIFAVGARAGYQWSWDFGLILDLNLGANYLNVNYTKIELGDPSDESHMLKNGINPNLAFSIGYRF